MEATLDMGFPVAPPESPSHEVVVERLDSEGRKWRVKFPEEVVPEKDFTLTIRPLGERMRKVALAQRGKEGTGFVALLLPPQPESLPERNSIEFIFVLDRSGSMAGVRGKAPIEQAKRALLRCLELLGSEDAFNIVIFCHETNVFRREPVPATLENLEKARRFVRRIYS